MKIGLIDHYLDQYHARHFPEWLKTYSGGEVEVTCAWAEMDSPKGRTTEKFCQDMQIHSAASIEEVIESCDGLIVFSPDHCERHEDLCQLPLRSGKPTFVDKTFAPDVATARRLFALADQYGTPCYSTSALRYAEEFKGIQNVQSLSAWGPNSFETYSVHQLEPLVLLMGDRPLRVMGMQGEDYYTLTIEFPNHRIATVSGYANGGPFMMNIASTDGNRVVEVKSDFYKGLICGMIDFFKHPEKIVPHEETLRVMALRMAGTKALENPGHWIEVED